MNSFPHHIFIYAAYHSHLHVKLSDLRPQKRAGNSGTLSNISPESDIQLICIGQLLFLLTLLTAI